ncbi:adenosylmethionine decarboxylase [Shewanella youngdeokensis]|uniref:Adenosylmethionine decarboxylase n=1 Tax=Shewanella youngdeokensis TaxID=2999068 RepID=A0ABZ0K2A4_9GAMM|nr:adenosylmethionine decarboxylase [Shewanella sp. DAU334]
MFFEGSEKKIELSVKAGVGSLRALERKFWERTLALAGADIVSVMSNSYCDAYVLSESSLFVWERKILLITCGNTQLIKAAFFLIDELAVENIASFSYQRKSEFLSHLQLTRFEDDVQQLRTRLPGSAYRVGHLDGHHHYLFNSDSYDIQCPSSSLLMYHIKGNVADYLRQPTQCKSSILKQLNFAQWLPDFDFDDHLFDPCGYSINGLSGERFLTMHITPQAQSAYVSIETDINDDLKVIQLFSSMLAILQPDSWDVISVNQHLAASDYPAHVEVAHCDLALNASNDINFKHFTQRASDKLIAQVL